MLSREELLQYLRFTTAGGRVKRFHTFPTINVQTDAEHSHGVCMLLYILAEGRPSASLLMAGLVHDLAEHKYSDVSAHTKNAVPGMSSMLHKLEGDALHKEGLDFLLTPQEQRWLEIADKLEGMLFSTHEQLMGNRYAQLTYQRFSEAVPELVSEAEYELYNAVEALHADIYAQHVIPYGGA